VYEFICIVALLLTISSLANFMVQIIGLANVEEEIPGAKWEVLPDLPIHWVGANFVVIFLLLTIYLDH
jgi:hypothetical protein